MKTKNKILPEQEEEKTFQYRTYGKGELALLYLPNILQQSAVDRFNEWIEAAPGLKERLPRHESTRQILHSRTSKAHHRSATRTLIKVSSIRYQVLTVVNASQQRITS